MTKLMLDESRENVSTKRRSKFESMCSGLDTDQKLDVISELYYDQQDLYPESSGIIERYLDSKYPDNPEDAFDYITEKQIDELFNKLCKAVPKEVKGMIDQLSLS